jgi:hypothetical protein
MADNDFLTGTFSGVSSPELSGKYPPSLPQALTLRRANWLATSCKHENNDHSVFYLHDQLLVILSLSLI